MARKFEPLLLLVHTFVTKPKWGFAYVTGEIQRIESRMRKRRLQEYYKHIISFNEGVSLAVNKDVEAIERLYKTAPFSRMHQEVSMALSSEPLLPFTPKLNADAALAEACYLICVLLKPSIVVETGVGYGVTSYFILQALHVNKQGLLYSIELPPLSRHAQDFVGHVVPAHLKDRWRLMFGPSKHLLPRLLETTGGTDIFIHDSIHTYHNMMAEWNVAWPFLRGLLISDDVDNNDAFIEFSEAKHQKPIILAQYNKKFLFGIIAK